MTAGSLSLRLAAALSLTGAGLFGALALAVTQLDRSSMADGAYRLPGLAGHTVDSLILPVLTTCAAVFALSGLALTILARIPGERTAVPRASRLRAKRRPAAVLLLGAAALVLALLYRRFAS